MFKLLQVFISCLLCLGALCGAEITKADLLPVLDEAIALAEKKDGKAFLERFIAPDGLKAMREKGSLQKQSKNLNNRWEYIVADLKKAKSLEPTIDQIKQRVTYCEADTCGGCEVEWIQIKGIWYLDME